MLTHKDIWTGIDRLAGSLGYSPSSLARKAGLDPTAFNKSKRLSPDGKPRWPSTESIAKILAVADLTMNDFIDLIGKRSRDIDGPVAIRLLDGSLIEGDLVKHSAKTVKIKTGGKPKTERTYKLSDIDWVARIVWSKDHE